MARPVLSRERRPHDGITWLMGEADAGIGANGSANGTAHQPIVSGEIEGYLVTPSLPETLDVAPFTSSQLHSESQPGANS